MRLADGSFLRSEGERNPDFGADWKTNVFVHDPNDLCRHAVETHRASDDRRIPAELIAPEIFGEDGDVFVAGLVFRGDESTAEQRADMKDIEEICGDLEALDFNGVACAGEVEVVPVISSQRFEGAVLRLPVEEVGGGNGVPVVAAAMAWREIHDRDEAVGVW